MLFGALPRPITPALTFVPFPASLFMPEFRIPLVTVPSYFALTTAISARPFPSFRRARPRTITEALAWVIGYTVRSVGKLRVTRIFSAFHVTFATNVVTSPPVTGVGTVKRPATGTVTAGPLVTSIPVHKVGVSQLDLPVHVTG